MIQMFIKPCTGNGADSFWHLQAVQNICKAVQRTSELVPNNQEVKKQYNNRIVQPVSAAVPDATLTYAEHTLG
jgi:hypothetical protein